MSQKRGHFRHRQRRAFELILGRELFGHGLFLNRNQYLCLGFWLTRSQNRHHLDCPGPDPQLWADQPHGLFHNRTPCLSDAVKQSKKRAVSRQHFCQRPARKIGGTALKETFCSRVQPDKPVIIVNQQQRKRQHIQQFSRHIFLLGMGKSTRFDHQLFPLPCFMLLIIWTDPENNDR